MKKTMTLTNRRIFQLAESINLFLRDSKDLYLPAKVNYYVQYNLKQVEDVAILLDQVRTDVGKKYGELTSDGAYNIPKENFDVAQKELDELFEAEKEITFYTFSLNDLNNIQLTPGQMRALFFMIEEPEAE